MSVTLSPEEVREAAGGYARPTEQLRELHRRGFWRAYRSKVTGQVVLERPHYDAVSMGLERGQSGSAGRPQVRPPKLRAVT